MDESDLSTFRCQPKRLGSGHLRIVEVDFLKPTSRNGGARDLETEARLTAAKLLAGRHDGGWE